MAGVPIDITLIVQSKCLLESIPSEKKNDAYNDIVMKLNNYIDNRCPHHIIYDHIDINPECSKTIKYCEYCYTTFS
tara:strand:- start:4732 stop:4959 length:228 start_codon:yes stop_codon:yes gene_type:complete